MGDGLAEEWEERYMGQPREKGLVDDGVAYRRRPICNGPAQ
jgi:hypothetical protein